MESVPTPEYVQIEPAGACNLRCKMCPISYRQDRPLHGSRRLMDFEFFTRVIDQFENMKTLHLQGLGEPMLNPRFFDMVEYAASKGIRVTTNSNLTLLDPRKAERCITSRLDGLFVSIDGATAGTYESIRINGRFDKVIRNLDLLQQTRKRIHSSKPALKMVMVLMRRNLPELPMLVELAATHDIEEVYGQQLSHDFGDGAFSERFKPLHDFVDSETLLAEDLAKVERYFDEAREKAARLGIQLRLPPTRPKQQLNGLRGSGGYCTWPWTGAYISFQGYAMPCCMVASPDQIHLGLLDGSNLDEIWNGQAYTDFRKQLASDQPLEICRNCSLYKGHF